MGRSEYNFKVKDVNKADNIIHNFLNANKFKEEEKNNEKYYKSGDAMIGYKYFSYSFNENELKIYAWLKGLTGEMGIEQKGVMKINVPSMEYKKVLTPLFNELEKEETSFEVTDKEIITNEIEAVKEETVDNVVNAETKEETNNVSNTFTDDLIKRKETMCEIGFWLSILGVFFSLIGMSYGILIYILDFYLAYQGLDTKKKGKAIASFVLSSISILIVFIHIIININS